MSDGIKPPTGYTIVDEGPVLDGDMVWTPSTFWAPAIGETVGRYVGDFLMVARPDGEPDRIAALEAENAQLKARLAEAQATLLEQDQLFNAEAVLKREAELLDRAEKAEAENTSLRAALATAEAISEGRLKTLIEKADEARREWIRVETLEAERQQLASCVKAVKEATTPFLLDVNDGGQWDSVAQGYPSDMREHRKALKDAVDGILQAGPGGDGKESENGHSRAE